MDVPVRFYPGGTDPLPAGNHPGDLVVDGPDVGGGGGQVDPGRVAGDLGIPYKTLERWRSLYRTERTLAPPNVVSSTGTPTSRERELERRLAHVERERDILKKALAICSRDPELRNGSK